MSVRILSNQHEELSSKFLKCEKKTFFCFDSKKMGRRAKLSVKTRAVVVVLHEEGFSTKKIGSKTVSQSAVNEKLRRKLENGCNKCCYRSGRPKAISKQEDKFIMCSKQEKLHPHSSWDSRATQLHAEITSICFNSTATSA